MACVYWRWPGLDAVCGMSSAARSEINLPNLLKHIHKCVCVCVRACVCNLRLIKPSSISRSHCDVPPVCCRTLTTSTHTHTNICAVRRQCCLQMGARTRTRAYLTAALECVALALALAHLTDGFNWATRVMRFMLLFCVCVWID